MMERMRGSLLADVAEAGSTAIGTVAWDPF
jgi:hypothetical protein